MSEGHSEEHPEEEAAGNEEIPPFPAAPAEQRRSYGIAPWLAALLIIVLAGVALSPFWARQLGPLLPWGARPAVSADEYAALAARVATIEQRPPAPSVNVDALKPAVNGLAKRIEQLETAVNDRTAPSGTDIDAIKSQMSGLTQRVDRLEAESGGDRQLENSVAATKAGLQNLEQRVATVEAQSVSRSGSVAEDLKNLREQFGQLDTTTTNLANRVAALEHQNQSQGIAELRTDAMLALLLAQMREAVEQARPFPAEYNAFRTLARDPGLAAAAEPLADAGRNGVASRSVLVKRLAELGGQIAAGTEPAAESNLGDKVLAHLRGLVTIRRIGGASQAGPEAAVNAAQTALARGDLAGAVAALDPLTGANAEAAQPWLRMARERLAVERTLDHLRELLTVRLGSAPAPHSASPPAAPEEPSEKARTPS